MLLTNCGDSAHVQLAKYIVFDEESDFHVQKSNAGAQGPKNKKNYRRNFKDKSP